MLLRLGYLEEAAILMEELIDAPELASNHLLHAVVSEYHQLNYNIDEAINHVEMAIALAKAQAEIQMLKVRLQSLRASAASLN